MSSEALNRRHFLLGSALAAATALGQDRKKNAAPAPAAPKPNVLLIIADDLAAWMLGCYGNREFKTPNIDNLARRGVRFQHGFVATPICSPSRAIYRPHADAAWRP